MTKTIQEQLAEQPHTGDPQLVQYVGTVEAYDKWAEVYDTDGNFLQRLDTFEMRALLPHFLDRVTARFPTQPQSSPLKLVDLGCGTGRNTIQLLEALSARRQSSEATSFQEVVGLDASPGMLEVAGSAIQAAVREKNLADTEVLLGVIDLLQGASSKAQLPPSLQASGAAGLISTLVLEHIPAKGFFEAASAMMLPGAYLLVTNMHADMGAISQAGFTDPQTGVKIRPTSYCHSVPEVLAAAEKAGFQVENLLSEEGENGVLEREVDQQLGEALGARAKKWVGIRVWFGICFSKK
ncbi:hypothetical protein N7448_007768 [Penicillium atrosanguineum]|uniref:Methyltransferase domain-containing protein n=1 Tax=Penicillium atrosanguineum TaxID=1132637 RepID=A0A9W9QFS7_9EURO|nr:uncharacterized protein N7443_001210 [Penicillium atrosanguineum]KAJ5126989.1 hypothetical protein N7448_007768 [Penicillium atrosanguineum]KAJ5314326.1 hypothetical protein N7443_001210 [Penicillium atrosanguineum]KAJ5331493.1 hypothetical protein N7476_001276 [Penicillium atrosanguineum]